jgi:Arc/MetJ family transcription regulator
VKSHHRDTLDLHKQCVEVVVNAKSSVRSKASGARVRSDLVRTNIVIDRELVEQVKKRTGATTAREAVQRALEQAAARFTIEDLRALRDLNAIRPGYDPKDPTAEDRFAHSGVAEPRVDYGAATGKKRKRK